MNERLISKYRTEIMGFAALWIGVLHAQMWFRFPLLQAYKLSGQGGVDLFLFLSGFGLYYAYQKGERGLVFYGKRMLRILPLYIPAVIARCYYFHYDLKWSLMFATSISFWTGFDRSYWYVGAVFVLYAIAPLYLKYFKDGREEKMTICAMAIALLVSLLFWHTTQLIFFVRVAIYFLGFYAGKRAYHNDPPIPGLTRKAAVSFVIGAVWLYLAFRFDHDEVILYGMGMYWYPNLLIIPPLCLFLSRAFEWLEAHRCGWYVKVHHAMGEASLAIYLLHDLCMKYFTPRIHIPASLSYNGILLHVLILILTVIISWIYQKAVFMIIGLIGKGKTA